MEFNSQTIRIVNDFSQLLPQQKTWVIGQILNSKLRKDDQEVPTQQRFVIHKAKDAFTKQESIDWIIDQLISVGSTNIIVGEPGCGKTYLMLSAAVCVALGKFWLGQATKQCKCLFLDEESGERRFSRRLCEVIRGEMGDEKTAIDFITLAQFRADNVDDVTQLEQLILSNNYGLVIIDALADIMTGDENSKQDVQPIFAELRKISERTGTAIILIHHTNKLGGYRGSSAIKGAVDLMLLVRAEKEKNIVFIEVEKSRDSEPIKIEAEMKWGQDMFWVVISGRHLGKDSMTHAEVLVYEYLQNRGATSKPDIENNIDGLAKSLIKKAIYSLSEKGLIIRTNPSQTGQGVVAIYDIVCKEVRQIV